MGKFLLELALFAGILCQIHLLVSRVNGQATPTANQPYTQTLASVASLYETGYGMDYSSPVFSGGNPYTAAPHVSDPSILRELARKEAARIVRTGDYQSFQEQLERNGALLQLMKSGL